MRGQQAIVVEEFKGLYNRGSDENCPPNYFIDCLNLEFTYRGFRSRNDFFLEDSFTGISGTFLDLYEFPRIDGTVRRMLLIKEAAGAFPVKLYDLDHLTSAPFLVSEFAIEVDAISAVSLFDRFYFASLIANNEHRIGALVRVYDGLVGAPNAGGLAPTGSSMVATEPGAGNVSAGIHLYAVAYETASGFITKPGPAVWTSKTSAGSKNINLASIPTGPSNITKRHLLATKLIPAYSPPQENFELFFLPTGTINDNTTTTLTFDFFDTELVDSADYLLDQMETIPAGPLFTIGNSLGVAGYRTDSSAVGDKRSIALISKAVEVESFSVDEGFIVVKPQQGGALRTGLDLNGTLYLFKQDLTLAIQPDPNLAPAEWGSPGVIDSSIGTTPFGIAIYLGAPFVIAGGAFIITKTGLQHFTGVYKNLAYVIDETWHLFPGAFNTSRAVVDPLHQKVYASLPINGATPDTLLVMNYKDGTESDLVKWSPWFSNYLTSYRGILVDAQGALKIVDSTNKLIYVYSVSAPIEESFISFIETPKFRFTNLGHISNFQMILLNALGDGNLTITAYSKDEIITDALPVIVLSLLPDRFFKRLLNFTSTMASFKLSVGVTTPALNPRWMEVKSLIIYGHVEAEEYPE